MTTYRRAGMEAANMNINTCRKGDTVNLVIVLRLRSIDFERLNLYFVQTKHFIALDVSDM